MEEIKKIIYIGNFNFPLGNAAGKRVYANGKIFRELGYDVIFIGTSSNIKFNTKIVETISTYDGFRYYNLPYPGNGADWFKYNYVFKITADFLQSSIKVKRNDIVIYYGSPTLSFFDMKLIHFCKTHDIRIISDCVDWLSSKTNNSLFNAIKWGDTFFQKAYLNKKTDGVIAISSYLSDYYNKTGLKTVIIPPLSPVKYSKSDLEFDSDNKIKICYAGLPFRKGIKIKDPKTLKDRIDITVDLLSYAKKNGCDFTFSTFGFTKDEFITALPSYKEKIDALSDNIIFHGNKPNEEVTKEIMSSDFTILIRDDKRETRAGFPTKVSESISCGTPVITTRTSDLEDYITDGENGFFLDLDKKSASLKKLSGILKMNKKEISKMKISCIESKIFYYKNYIKKIETFLTM